MHEILILDLPIFIFATVSVMFFYFYSEIIVINETLSMKGRKKISVIYYIPFTIAIGIGLAINNSKAVLEALFRKSSPFVRTPKYNVTDRKKDHLDKTFYKVFTNVYRIKKIDWVSIIELCLGIYFTYAVYYAFYSGLYFSLPFLMLFQVGFLYTSFLSIFYAPLMMFFRKK